MVRVPLDPEHHRRAHRVPAVHVVDGLVDAVFVLQSQQAVVLDVVDCLQVDDAPVGIDHLVSEAFPPEDHIDGPGQQAVEEARLDHLVVGQFREVRLFASELSFDPALFPTEYGRHVAGYRVNNETVDAHVLRSSGWVIWRRDCSVVALDVLVEEVRVEELRVSERTDDFVVAIFAVQQLVARNGVQAGEETEYGREYVVLDPGLRLGPEEPRLRLAFNTEHRQGPDPQQRLNPNEDLDGDGEPPVRVPLALDTLA